jgi:hypothetical protein
MIIAVRGTLTALLLLGALTMTACSGGAATSSAPVASGAPGASSASPSPSYRTAREELMAAFARTATTTSTYAAESTKPGGEVTGTMSGVSDPARHALSGKSQARTPTSAVTREVELTIIRDDLYLRDGVPSAPGTWTHMSAARAPVAASSNFAAIVSLFAAAGPGIVDAEKTGPGAFKGTFDPAKAARSSLGPSERGPQIPYEAYEATVDTSGYVTALVLPPSSDAAGIAQNTTTIHLSDIGKPVTIAAPPAADVKEISEDAYKLYGGS